MLAATPRAELLFNYLGQFDQAASDGRWHGAAESTGQDRSPQQRRPHLLVVNADISGGRLHVKWGFSTAAYDKDTIAKLALQCLQEVRDLIAHCCQTAAAYTPSDFPLAALSQEQMDRLASTVRRRKATS